MQFRAIAVFATLLSLPLVVHAAPERIAPRVLIITTYEIGKDSGDKPGELQFWMEREHLTQSIAVPGVEHPLLTNGKGLYAMICGITSRSAVTMMALAMDPRFDFSHTYFLLDGIAGGDPTQITLGSAVWVRQVVDGDPAFEIDSRETPADWAYGTIAHGAKRPVTYPTVIEDPLMAGAAGGSSGGIGAMAWKLNQTLVDWAFQLTKGLTVPDTDGMAATRAKFKGYAAAQRKPFVMEGDSLGTDHFWHGAIMTQWARDWVGLYTHGTGTFVVSDDEDQGILLAMTRLGTMGRVDINRLLILRTTSNFTLQPEGLTANQSLFDNLVGSSGYIPSLNVDYQVGKVVVDALLSNWARYEQQVP